MHYPRREYTPISERINTCRDGRQEPWGVALEGAEEVGQAQGPAIERGQGVICVSIYIQGGTTLVYVQQKGWSYSCPASRSRAAISGFAAMVNGV